MSRFLRLVLLSLTLSIALAGSASAGTIVADSGFRPGVDGFSFENYGNEDGYANLNAAEMQKLYGRAVCLAGKGADCVLHPAARSWMKQVNAAMDNGHCYGFSTLALLIRSGKLPRFGYKAITAFGGGPPTFDLDITKSKLLQRSIARAFTYQALTSVKNNEIKGTPKRILDFLIEHLGDSSGETWNLDIFKWGFQGGHAITPYAVEDMGDGKYEIHVYDNNWPGDDNRRVKVDTAANTWSYYASTQPGEPQALYEGNAKSKTLDLAPNLPALGIQPCPFCVGRQGARSKYNQISLSGTADQHAHLLITDRKGRQTGFRGARLINHIPGARVLPQKSSGIEFAADGSIETIADSPEPIYLVPKRLKLRIKIDGRKMKVTDKESLGVVGPTFDSTIENLRMGPGKVAFATLSPKAKTLSMTGAKGESSPRVTFGAQSEQAAYRINVSALGAPSRSTFYFAKKPRYRLLRIGKKAGGKQTWRVRIDKFDATGTKKFGLRYNLRRRQVAFLYYGPLAAGKRAYVAIASQNGNRVRLLKLRKVSK